MTTLVLLRSALPKLYLQNSAELLAGLQQRATLLAAVLTDLSGPRTTLDRGLLPSASIFSEKIMSEPTMSELAGASFTTYTADLASCADGEWRVVRDRARGHPALEAPVLSVFLPALSRFLLDEKLRLASLPGRWLADRGAKQMLAADYRRWTIRDAFDPEAPPVALAELDGPARARLQADIEATPWRFLGCFLPAPLSTCVSVTLTGSDRHWDLVTT